MSMVIYYNYYNVIHCILMLQYDMNDFISNEQLVEWGPECSLNLLYLLYIYIFDVY